ncbi:phospholipase D-like domain-containing protein [Shewanella sp. 10N.286.52.A9]|uniref:phospholipase D-like domain-containing protein n=1 Tax=Shewanella sp. 10N.286.52.A9 TaxID=3229711 RepID=UPI003550816D
MKLSELTVNALTPFVTGDNGQSPYLSGSELIKFFNSFGMNDQYLQRQGGLPNAWSRKEYAFETLKKINGNVEFKALVEALTDSRKVDNPDDIAHQLNEIIKHDGYVLNENDIGVYKISGQGLESPILIEAHFQQIKVQILESIQSAKFSIWVAVAWFTDKDLANELRIKHRKGINVRVIVNDDKTTEQHGLSFDKKGIEYAKISPNSVWGKN